MIAAAAALAGLLTYGMLAKGAGSTFNEAVVSGKRLPAPAARLPMLGGPVDRNTTLDAYRGKVVVLNLWASWCGPCKDELPLLEATHKKLASDGGVVVGINTKDLIDGGLGAVREYGLTFPSLRDGDGAYARALEHTGVPETFVLDRQGRIAAIRRFPIDQEWLDAVLPPLLAEPA